MWIKIRLGLVLQLQSCKHLNIVQSNRNSIEKMNEVEAFGEHKARWITISSDEYESMKSTLEVLSDPELMEQIKESREDFKAGNFKKLRDVLKETESND